MIVTLPEMKSDFDVTLQ